jgi:hypothetical protein
VKGLKMAVKSYWITVTEGNFKKIEHKQFFLVKDANEFYKEMIEKYPKPQYIVIKEYY